MNEPVAFEPQAARGDDSHRAATPAGFGYALAQARVRAGLSVEQAAARIRLHPRQLQAIENEDLQALPVAAYVNGFVRNYARELGIDAGPLIDDLNAKLKLRGLSSPEPDLGPRGTVHTPALDERAWRHLVLAAIVLALICAGLIGVWMARSPSHTSGGPAARTPAQSAAPAGETDAPPSASVAVPLPVAPVAAGGAGAPVQGVAAPALAAPAEAPMDVEGNGNTPARIPVASLGPSTGTTSGLLLRFTERSWVEVSQPDGRVLLSRIGEPGSIEQVNASAPLVLVVGRADAVLVEYRGQPVNLKPYVNTTNGVARVLLADGASGGQSNR
jgi:cytoskeleton protein RodZ